MDDASPTRTGWTFLTNHARVLAAIAGNPGIRVRDIAAHCLLTERAVQKIIADLERDGYLTHIRSGRSNTYQIPPGTLLRHPADAGTVADLLSLLTSRMDGERANGERGHDGRAHGERGHDGRAHDGRALGGPGE